MSDLLQVADLEKTKFHNTFHVEAVTGKVGGLAGGADIDFTTNAVTGQVQKTLPKILADIDWSYVGLFADVVTFTKSTDFAVDDSGIQWIYTGTYPFTTEPATIPSDPLYQVVHVRDHNSFSNINAAGGHDAIYSRNFKTVSDLKNGIDASGQSINMSLIVGSKVFWSGYYSESDGGSNWGVVKTGAHTEDGGSIFSIDSNTYIAANLKGDRINLKKFGAVSDNSTDSTGSVNAAILYLAKLDDLTSFRWTSGELYFPFGSYSVQGTIKLIRNLKIDLQKSTLRGNPSATMFETGYYDPVSATIKSNLLTTPESNTVWSCEVSGGTIRDSGVAFDLYNFLKQCGVININFFDCVRPIRAKRSFYAIFENNLISDTTGISQFGIPAIDLIDNNNAQIFKGNTITGRDISLKVSGATFQMHITDNTFEQGNNSIIIENETFSLNIENNYFESNAGTLIDMSYSAQHKNTNIDNNLFFHEGKIFKGTIMNGGVFGDGNAFGDSVPDDSVEIIDDINSTITVHVPKKSIGASEFDQRLIVDAKFKLSKNVKVVGDVSIRSDATGFDLVRSNALNSPSDTVRLNYGGSQGEVTGKVPYCTHVADSAGPTFNVIVTTQIQAATYGITHYAMTISDGVGANFMAGTIYGTAVSEQVSVAGKSVTASFVGGVLTLKFNGFNNAGAVYGITGVVRISS